MNIRIILVVVLVIVIVAVGGFFLLQQNSGSGSGTPVPGRTSIAPDATIPPSPTPIPVTEVVIAVQDIPRGVEIQPNMVTVISFPLEFLPQGTFGDLNAVVGRIARTDISREQLILARQIISGSFTQAAAELGRVGSDAAAVLEPGRVAIALPIDAITSVAYALQPGDSVDVLVSMLFVDIDQDYQTILPNEQQILSLSPIAPPPECFTGELSGTICDVSYLIEAGDVFTGSNFDIIPINTGTSIGTLPLSVFQLPTEAQRPRLVTQRTVRDARVIWIGEFPEDGRIFRAAPTPTPIVTADPNAEEAGDPDAPPTNTPIPPRPSIVTLGVTPQDAVTLTYMAEASLPMTFALRSARAVGLPETQAVTLDYIMTNFGIQVPDRFSFTVEPAIRSIRQLSLGERISLSDEDEPAAAPAASSE